MRNSSRHFSGGQDWWTTEGKSLPPSGMDAMGPVTKKLYDTLTGIQMGTIKRQGWIPQNRITPYNIGFDYYKKSEYIRKHVFKRIIRASGIY